MNYSLFRPQLAAGGLEATLRTERGLTSRE
jgi:hypothetical protein